MWGAILSAFSICSLGGHCSVVVGVSVSHIGPSQTLQEFLDGMLALTPSSLNAHLPKAISGENPESDADRAVFQKACTALPRLPRSSGLKECIDPSDPAKLLPIQLGTAFMRAPRLRRERLHFARPQHARIGLLHHKVIQKQVHQQILTATLGASTAKGIFGND